jgi:hypothetical protein
VNVLAFLLDDTVNYNRIIMHDTLHISQKEKTLGLTALADGWHCPEAPQAGLWVLVLLNFGREASKAMVAFANGRGWQYE